MIHHHKPIYACSAQKGHHSLGNIFLTSLFFRKCIKEKCCLEPNPHLCLEYIVNLCLILKLQLSIGPDDTFQGDLQVMNGLKTTHQHSLYPAISALFGLQQFKQDS